MKNKWYVPALRGVLGDWVYYSTLMSGDQVSRYIIPSHEIREAKALEDFLQRTLKPRVNKIALYLRKRDFRFFCSIIVGVFDGLPSWAEFDLSGVAGLSQARNLTELRESVGLLAFSGNEKMFAIDGQHRVEGIKAAFSKDPERFQSDQYSAIFVAHLDTPAGKVRTRRLFCDINKNAVAVSPGDKVVIDEDDLPAIVTRRIYADYPAFKHGKLIAVSERKEVVSQGKEERFTSLLALYTVAKKLKKLFHKQRGTLDFEPQNVTEFQRIVAEFLDFVFEHEPSLRRYFNGSRTTLKRERQDNRNLFFRPVGLEVLARLYVYFAEKNKLPIMEYGLQNLPFKNPGGIFDGILWNAGKIEASAKARKAAVGFCLYMLHQLDQPRETQLVETLREVRKNQNYALPPKPSRFEI